MLFKIDILKYNDVGKNINGKMFVKFVWYYIKIRYNRIKIIIFNLDKDRCN